MSDAAWTPPFRDAERRAAFRDAEHATRNTAQVWEQDGSDPCRVRVLLDVADTLCAWADGRGTPDGPARAWRAHLARLVDETDTTQSVEVLHVLRRLVSAANATYTHEGVLLYLQQLADRAEALAGGPALDRLQGKHATSIGTTDSACPSASRG